MVRSTVRLTWFAVSPSSPHNPRPRQQVDTTQNRSLTHGESKIELRYHTTHERDKRHSELEFPHDSIKSNMLIKISKYRFFSLFGTIRFFDRVEAGQ